MDRERLDNWCEKGILGLVLVILVFSPVALGAVRIQEFLVIQGLTLGVVLLWLARFWLSPSYRLLWPPMCWAVLAFVAYAIIRYRYADIEYVARWELIRVLVYAFLFFAIVNNLSHQGYSRILVMSLVVVATAISLAAVYQFVKHTNHVWGIPKLPFYLNRATGTYDCPNHLAGFLEMVVPLGLAFTLTSRMPHVIKVGLGYSTLVMLAGIGASLSRGGWIAMGLALMVFFGVLFSQRFYRLPALVFLLVLLVAGVGFVAKNRLSQKRFASMFTTGKVEDVRFLLWRPAIQMWQENFWLGVGPAHFDQRFRQSRPEEVQQRPGWVHNDYLNTLADWGAIGGLLVGSAWLLLFAGVARIWSRVRPAPNDLSPRRSNRLALVLGAASGLLAILLHSVVDFNMQIPANAIVAITLTAILTGQWRHVSDRWWRRLNLIGKSLATAICVTGLVYLGYQGLCRWQTELLYKQAAKDGLALRNQVEILKQAYAVDPMNYKTAYRIGEALREESWEGDSGYEDFAIEAMKWFERGMALNPFDPYCPLRYGMCLDWLGRSDEAAGFFERARRLDPNSYYILAHLGWHHVQVGDYVTARGWLERSLRLMPQDNSVASSYLDIVNARLSQPK